MMGLSDCVENRDYSYFFEMLSSDWTNYFIGKDKCTTYAFLVIVDNDKKVFMNFFSLGKRGRKSSRTEA